MVLVQPDHAVAVAAALRAVRDERLLADDAFRALQNAALRFDGPENQSLTVGLGSLRWNGLRDGKWAPVDAPQFVGVELPVRSGASARKPASEPTPRPMKPQPMTLTCGNCGKVIAPGKKFCTACGTPVESQGRSA